jgi:hypothetical protein
MRFSVGIVIAGFSLFAGCGAATPEELAQGLGDDPPTLYRVTLTNTTGFQGFSFPVAATHAAGFHLFQVGAAASPQAAAVAQNGNPVGAFKLAQSHLGNDVTDAYAHAFPVASAGNPTALWKAGLPAFDPAGASGPNLYPTTSAHNLSNTITFDLVAKHKDKLSVLGMMMCTNDGLAGLDSVALPKDAAHPVTYALATYDAGVEANTFYTPDVVDPCALMAPFANGAPQLSTSDGNKNSAPTPSQGSAGLFSVEPDLGVALATSDPIAPLDGTIPDNSGQPNASSFVPASWGWQGSVGTVTIAKIGD